MLLGLLALCSLAVAAQPVAQKLSPMQSRVLKADVLKTMKIGEVKDTDIIETKEGRITGKELKLRIQKNQEMAAKKSGAAFSKKASQTLQQLKAGEESKRRMENQTIRRDVAAKMKGARPQVRPCDGPKITGVYPNTANPGDPLLITGCGLLAQQGEASLVVYPRKDLGRSGGGVVPIPIPQEYAKLTIRSWSDTAIEAMIPDLPLSQSVSVMAKAKRRAARRLLLRLRLS